MICLCKEKTKEEVPRLLVNRRMKQNKKRRDRTTNNAWMNIMNKKEEAIDRSQWAQGASQSVLYGHVMYRSLEHEKAAKEPWKPSDTPRECGESPKQEETR
eukprot:720462_1